ncbi:hypothetical protein TNCV_228071 [Trichonephila clavipes]|nr:hypothetical protein TNCV_228071 [Trichonephila clavipes]
MFGYRKQSIVVVHRKDAMENAVFQKGRIMQCVGCILSLSKWANTTVREPNISLSTILKHFLGIVNLEEEDLRTDFYGYGDSPLKNASYKNSSMDRRSKLRTFPRLLELRKVKLK